MKLITAQKTIEFRYPDNLVPLEWYQTLTRVWNQAVFYLNWRQHYQRIQECAKLGIQIDPLIEIGCRKEGDAWISYQKTEIQRRIDRTKSWDKENVELVPVNRIPCRFLTVHPLWATEPPIAWDVKITAIELRKPFAAKRCEWIKESTIPQVLVNDFVDLVVIPAWEAYQKGQRGKPRYKKSGELIDTIVSSSFRAVARYYGNDWLKLPGLDKQQIHGLDYRLMMPIAQMVEAMAAQPEDFPAVQKKLDKLLQKERSALIKAEGYDIRNLRKTLDDEAFNEFLSKYDSRVDRTGHLDKTIEYFASPGAFKLVRRLGKTYLQISAEMPSHARATSKSVEIATGIDRLIVGSNGLDVKHQDLSQADRRLRNLDRAISRCQHGSNAWKKLMSKKRRIEGGVSRSKKSRQAYFAAQIAAVNAEITINKVEIKPAVGLPIPRPDGDGGYLPNGATKAKAKNKVIHDVATGQFVLLCEQQAKRRGRKLTKVDPVAPDSANPEDNSPSTVEIPEMVSRKGKRGKAKATPGSTKTKKQASGDAAKANPPEPLKFKARDRKREKRIG